MSFLALILWCVFSGGLMVECPEVPLDYGLVGQISTEAEQPLLKWKASRYDIVEQTTTQKIYHLWFSSWDNRQLMVQKAYDLWDLDFVTMIECESWFNPKARWDSWKSYGLCQMNSRWHKIPQEYYNSWEYQIDYCYQKRKGWTKFYWPQRKIHGHACKDYVKSRFIINS